MLGVLFLDSASGPGVKRAFILSTISAMTDLRGLVWLFVEVGGVMSVLGFASCIRAPRENTFLLKFFSMFLHLIIFLELETGIPAFDFKD